MDEKKKQRYLAIAEKLTELVGGKRNIQGVAHCATRLRIVLENNDVVDLKTIEDLDAFLTEAHEKVPNITTFESGFPRGNTYSDVLAMLNAKYEMDSMNYHMLTFDLNTHMPIQ